MRDTSVEVWAPSFDANNRGQLSKVEYVMHRMDEVFYARTSLAVLSTPYRWGDCANKWLGGGWKFHFDSSHCRHLLGET